MNQHQSNVWDEQSIARLREMWNTDVSAATMALEIGTSKNSIIGKAHRLGLPRKQAPTSMGPKPRKPSYKTSDPKEWKAKETLAPQSIANEPAGPGVPFLWLRSNHCRYIGGTPRGLDTLFCGHPKANEAYCSFHAKVCTHTRGSPKPVLQ